MAKSKVFTVYDSKAEAFLPPFFMRATGEAVRAFQSEVENPQSNFSRHPADFTLFELGEFDDVTGQFELFAAKKALGTALEYKKKPEGVTPLERLQGGSH